MFKFVYTENLHIIILYFVRLCFKFQHNIASLSYKIWIEKQFKSKKKKNTTQWKKKCYRYSHVMWEDESNGYEMFISILVKCEF